MLNAESKIVPKVQNLVVSSESAGQRLDNFLITFLKGVPRTRIYRIVRKGEVRINKGRVKPDYRLSEGDIIRVPPVRVSDPKETPSPSQNVRRILDHVLYEDDDLLILNKPAGMAVHGGSGVSLGVIEALRAIRTTEKSLELVHRLDRETSGCLMIAKRRRTLKGIQAQFQTGEVKKVYWALVKGAWKGGSSISEPLQKNHLSSGERIVRISEEGQPALTEFEILEPFARATLLEVKPMTGRTHQIRVHAAFGGSPIAMDLKYGDNDFNQQMKRIGINRLFLHAKQITLTLPKTGEVLTIHAPLDQAMIEGLEKLKQEKIYV